ncbi:hypothetical protein FI667_g696, partial [Globisporangium splendens]
MASKMQMKLLQRAVSGMHCTPATQRRVFMATRANWAAAAPVAARARFFTGSRMLLHGDDDEDHVKIDPKTNAAAALLDHDHDHGHDGDDDSDDDDDMEDVVDIGPLGKEYGGPQRGGKFKEPTRFGDWERKGRCSDF